jgi:hypothetical protein
MSVGPVVAGAGGSVQGHGRPSFLAWWAVVVAATAAVLVVIGVVVFGVAYAIGGEEATADNWVGLVSVFAILLGLPMSLLAFAMAVVAKVRHEPWRTLWLPLAVFPAVAAFLVLGELLWWE